MNTSLKQAGAESRVAVQVSHIGNTGSRSQYPVFKVLGNGLDFTVIPEKREATFIAEFKVCDEIRRRTVHVTNEKVINWLIHEVHVFLSLSAQPSTVSGSCQ